MQHVASAVEKLKNDERVGQVPCSRQREMRVLEKQQSALSAEVQRLRREKKKLLAENEARARIQAAVRMIDRLPYSRHIADCPASHQARAGAGRAHA